MNKLFTENQAHVIMGAFCKTEEYDETGVNEVCTYVHNYEDENDLVDQLYCEHPEIVELYSDHPRVRELCHLNAPKTCCYGDTCSQEECNENKCDEDKCDEDEAPSNGLSFVELNPIERSRIYWYYHNKDETFFPYAVHNVCRLAVSESGTHRLETTDGKKVIMDGSWTSIDIDVDDWTF